MAKKVNDRDARAERRMEVIERRNYKKSVLEHRREMIKEKNLLLGTESKGVPYVGRGLIQLTGKEDQPHPKQKKEKFNLINFFKDDLGKLILFFKR